MTCIDCKLIKIIIIVFFTEKIIIYYSYNCNKIYYNYYSYMEPFVSKNIYFPIKRNKSINIRRFQREGIYQNINIHKNLV